MSLTQIQYNCCLNGNGLPDCVKLDPQPDQIKTPACKNAMVRHCQTSANIVTPMCRTFISNLVQNAPPLSDMDQPVISFCATQREEKNPSYNDCKCVNVANTCLGQKIMRFKAGNPGCYYPPCKENNIFTTSALWARSCKSVTCTIGDITIQAGKDSKIVNPPGMINQNCGNLTPQPPRPTSNVKFFDHSSSVCTGKKLTGENASSSLPEETAKTSCRDLCIGRDDCNAYQTECPPGGSTCQCDLFSTNGFGIPKKADCDTSKTGNWSQAEYEKLCGGISGADPKISSFFCADQRTPAAKKGGADGDLPHAKSNSDPPDGFKAKAGSGPCKCQGSGIGLDSCGSLCCADSPYTSTDPTDKDYFMNGGQKSKANVCWEKA